MELAAEQREGLERIRLAVEAMMPAFRAMARALQEIVNDLAPYFRGLAELMDEGESMQGRFRHDGFVDVAPSTPDAWSEFLGQTEERLAAGAADDLRRALATTQGGTVNGLRPDGFTQPLVRGGDFALGVSGMALGACWVRTGQAVLIELALAGRRRCRFRAVVDASTGAGAFTYRSEGPVAIHHADGDFFTYQGFEPEGKAKGVEFAAAAPDVPAASLRAVHRWTGNAWQRVRMQQLRTGDLFKLETVPGDGDLMRDTAWLAASDGRDAPPGEGLPGEGRIDAYPHPLPPPAADPLQPLRDALLTARTPTARTLSPGTPGIGVGIEARPAELIQEAGVYCLRHRFGTGYAIAVGDVLRVRIPWGAGPAGLSYEAVVTARHPADPFGLSAITCESRGDVTVTDPDGIETVIR